MIKLIESRKALFLGGIILSQFSNVHSENYEKLPNILWITSEDNSPMLKCYGDDFATTPNLDRLASEGFLYTHAYANAPVSAAARNTIITGVYACSAGNHNMRSRYLKSDKIRLYPELLRKIGYYCTNNSKEDYNISIRQTSNIWDDSSNKAHYNNRKPGQPFFAVFNSAISHESCIHQSIPDELLRHDPNKVKLPPYHPDTREIRHDWAQYYDKLEDMDAWVGKLIKELKDSGELENTIIFYYGDHGGVLGRSKRFIYETGTKVPFIVRIPEKFKHLYPSSKPGDKVDRLISFVDLAPTLLSIVGMNIPEWMQGNAFLGEQKSNEQDYVFMFRNRMDERYDMSRAVRSKKYRYIRNYMPHRIYGQHINFLWKAPSISSWQEAYENGRCNKIQSAFWETKPSEELYDTENDPWEINNLAENPSYKGILNEMRKVLDSWLINIKDADFIPESEYDKINEKGMALYDYMRSGNNSLETILSIANKASSGNKENIGFFIENLSNKDESIRYWAATGILILGENGSKAIPQLMKAMNDTSHSVAVVSCEALYRLGKKKLAKKRLIELLDNKNIFIRNHVLNVLDLVDNCDDDVKKAVLELLEKSSNNKDPMRYDIRMMQWLKLKWEL